MNDFNWRKCYARYINLSYRKDREEHMQAELSRVGLDIKRFEAFKVDDYEWDMGKYGVMYNRTKGACGCYKSQITVMENALKNNCDAFVCEDDLLFADDIQERLDYAQNFLNRQNSWDVLFGGGTVHINPPWWHKKGHSPDLQMCDCDLGRDAEQTEDPHMLRTFGCFSTHCYIVNKNSIEKILKYFDDNVHLAMGVDWLFIKMQPQLKAYCQAPGMAIQIDNMSDIGNGITVFSGFKMLGAHWFAKKMSDFDPLTYNWAEAEKR